VLGANRSGKGGETHLSRGRIARSRAIASAFARFPANQLKSELDVEKYDPLAKADAVSKQDFDNATQTNLANKAQVQAAGAAIAAAKAQIRVGKAAVETAAINLNFTRVVSPIDGIAGIAQAQVGDLVSTSSGPLTTVSTLDPIRDYFTVGEQEYLALQKRLSDSDKDLWKLQLILANGRTSLPMFIPPLSRCRSLSA
jgi:membrane fusion protein (multidrug efflux system)